MSPWMIARWMLMACLVGFLFGMWGSLYIWMSAVLIGISFCCFWGIRFWFVLICVVLCSALYTSWRQTLLKSSLAPFVKEEVVLEGTIHRFPETRKTYTRVYLKNICIIDEVCLDSSESVLVRVPLDIPVQYGDRLQVAGKLSSPRSFGEFNYKAYLERFSVFTLLTHPTSVAVLERDKGNVAWSYGYSIRQWFSQHISQTIAYPHNVIGTGVLLGVKEVLPSPIDEAFRNAGLQHLVVVSGFNVVVISYLVLWGTRRWGLMWSHLSAISILILFLLITGGDPPVVRAVIMESIALWGGMFGGNRNGKTLLLLTAVLMGVWNPLMITRDISFQLSFMATAGILVFVRPFEELFKRWPGWLGTVLSVTLSAQVAVFPLLGWYFETFPLGGIVANVVVEPLVPLIMLGAFLSGMLHVVSPAAGELVGLLTEGLIVLLFWCARIFASFGVFEVPDWMVFLVGGGVGYFILRTLLRD